MNTDLYTSSELRALLEQTINIHVSPHAEILNLESFILPARPSGLEFRHHKLELKMSNDQTKTIKLVTKHARLIERKIYDLLARELPQLVPFNHTLDLDSDTKMWVCMDDLGDETHPNSLAPFEENVFESEAVGLAQIHSRFQGKTLDWLLPTDHAYFHWFIEKFWRPKWERAVSNNDFVKEFGDSISRVETTASSIVREMTALGAESEFQTLLHADINPGNEIIRDGRVYFVDWDAARRGSLFLDIPHHFFTLELGERYRLALAKCGVDIPVSDFAERYRIAAHYIALRYMFWTLEAWEEDRNMDVWVRHYLDRLLV